jgi:hypothetical protein
MELIISIIFFIMFLVIIGVLIYLIYDFINYKEAVDKTNEENTIALRSSLLRFSNNLTSNINNTDTMLLSQILQNSGKISHLEYDTSNLNFKSSETRSNVSDFDANLKHFFRFKNNNVALDTSQKIYDYVFGPTGKNIDLITKVTAASGMTINTPTSDMSFKICNNSSNCIDMKVTDKSFNIMPANLDNMTFLSKNSTPLAKFDMENDKLFFGGNNEDNSPMFIHNSNLYINEMNIRRKSDPERRSLKLSGDTINTMIGRYNSNIDLYATQSFNIGNSLNKINTNLHTLTSNVNTVKDTVVVHYQLYSTGLDTDDPTSTYYNQTMTLKINPIYDLEANTTIEIYISQDTIGQYRPPVERDERGRPTSPQREISLTKSDLIDTVVAINGFTRVTVKTTAAYPKGVPIIASFSGVNIFTSISPSYINGVTLGKLIVNPSRLTYPYGEVSGNILSYLSDADEYTGNYAQVFRDSNTGLMNFK